MRYTVALSIVLFLITVAILIYYAVFIDGGHFLVGGNVAIDALMLSLVVLAGIIVGIVYLFSSRAGISSGRNVQAIQY